MKIKTIHLAILIFFLVIILSVSLIYSVFSSQTSQSSNFQNLSGSSTIYLIYSSSCPHCHHLIETLQSLDLKGVSIIQSMNGKEAFYCLNQRNFTWNFGVPIVFALVNDKLIVIEGYPSSSQDVNGYFLGKEKEESFCKSMNGNPIYDNSGNYLFCKLPDGTILGNKYAIEYLIDLCKKNSCQAFCSL
ncbi:MAG: hypothetical protein B6U78_01180 [Candidatus Aenigmarchaeota archaeon ex4484_224]|nr:MAG: hypothetical protein B6U78_01180 [Candidatus Aenigmarchaeota archaeon ex4484_224]